MRRTPVVAACWLAFATGCQALFGTEADLGGAGGDAAGGSGGAGGDGAATGHGGATASTGTGASGGGSPDPCAASCLPIPADPAWETFFEVLPTTENDATPCADGSPPQLLHADPPADPASCSACGCGAPQGATCAPAPLVCYGASDCTGGNETHTGIGNGGCASAASVPFYCKSSPAQIGNKGACPPNGGVATITSTWGSTYRACPLPFEVGACSSGNTCVSAAGATPCIKRNGDATCPAEYPQTIFAYQSATDTRSCSACTCSLPTNLSCLGGKYVFSADPFCVGSQKSVLPDGACVDTNDTYYVSYQPATVDASGSSCVPAGGGQPVGEFTPTAPVRVCCAAAPIE